MSTAKAKEAAIVIQDRDVALLRGLFESRVMALRHVAALHFDGRMEAAKKRLQKLKAAGLIAERPRKTFDQAILYLAKPGLLALRERGILQEYPPFDLPTLEKRARVSDATLRHELEVMDVKAAFHSAVASTSNLTVAEFTTWPLLNQFEIGHALVKPDGYIRLHETNADGGIVEHRFFLEIDRSTESLGSLVERAASYLRYYKSGGFAARHGSPRSGYSEYPFRVLMVFTTEERRANLARRLQHAKPPVLTLAWLAIMPQVVTRPLEAIWIRPVDDRDGRQLSLT